MDGSLLRSGAFGRRVATAALALFGILLQACSGAGSGPAAGILPGGSSIHQASVHPNAVTNVYLGGAGLSALADRAWFDYFGVALPPDPQGASNGLPVNGNYEYYYDSDGAGNGLIAWISQVPDNSTPSVPPYPCPNQQTSCIPYPEWDGTSADSALSSSQITCYQVGGPCGVGGATIGPTQPARGQYLALPEFESDLAFAYNPNGQTVGGSGLNLSRNSYCGIWEGAITNWADPSITADNGGTVVSTQPIELIVRSDNAGATFVLTNHLNTACQNLSNPAYDWTRGVGTSGITWPSNSMAFKGQGGIVSGVTSTSGGIGYVAPSYVAPVVGGGLPSANLQNHYYFNLNKKKFIAQNVSGTLAAFKGISPPSNPNPWDLGFNNPDPTQAGAYPVVAMIYFDLYQCYQTSATAKGLKFFLNWMAAPDVSGLTPADQIVESEGFAPAPSAFKKKVKSLAVNIVAGPITNVCTI